MKVAIFGASGRTGRLLTARCLAEGHEVSVLLRPEAEFAWRARVRVVEGSIFDAAAMRQTIDGGEAVLSALGPRTLEREETLERAVPLMVAAMRQVGASRIIVLGAAGALPTALDGQPAWRRWLVQAVVYDRLLRWPVAAQAAQWRTLAASGLDFTMVMPPRLTNGPARGRYRVAAEALPRNGTHISRADVANFMAAQVGSPEWVGRAVYLSY